MEVKKTLFSLTKSCLKQEQIRLNKLRPCFKIVNFDRTEAGLTPKWNRISAAVQWCYHIYIVQRPLVENSTNFFFETHPYALFLHESVSDIGCTSLIKL